jgi:hypothetical protein
MMPSCQHAETHRSEMRMSLSHPHGISQHRLTIPVHCTPLERKRARVSLGLWAMRTGRGWLVHTVYRALVRERLTHG